MVSGAWPVVGVTVVVVGGCGLWVVVLPYAYLSLTSDTSQ